LVFNQFITRKSKEEFDEDNFHSYCKEELGLMNERVKFKQTQALLYSSVYLVSAFSFFDSSYSKRVLALEAGKIKNFNNSIVPANNKSQNETSRAGSFVKRYES